MAVDDLERDFIQSCHNAQKYNEEASLIHEDSIVLENVFLNARAKLEQENEPQEGEELAVDQEDDVVEIIQGDDRFTVNYDMTTNTPEEQEEEDHWSGTKMQFNISTSLKMGPMDIEEERQSDNDSVKVRIKLKGRKGENSYSSSSSRRNSKRASRRLFSEEDDEEVQERWIETYKRKGIKYVSYNEKKNIVHMLHCCHWTKRASYYLFMCMSKGCRRLNLEEVYLNLVEEEWRPIRGKPPSVNLTRIQTLISLSSAVQSIVSVMPYTMQPPKQKELLFKRGPVAMEYWACCSPPRLQGKYSLHEGTGGHAVLGVLLTAAPQRKNSPRRDWWPCSIGCGTLHCASEKNLYTKGPVAMQYWVWCSPLRLQEKPLHQGTGGHAVLGVVLTAAPPRTISLHQGTGGHDVLDVAAPPRNISPIS
uniref:Uncharacterized protein n=1 Tax=Timema cristinae TaxID=61476 RepID=A0A7R9H4U8_TIMCR|nr:unnamed protein product [Timema cristinae]